MQSSSGNAVPNYEHQVQDVTEGLNALLADPAEVAGAALMLIKKSSLLGRETLSAALGELSEHLIARMVGGERKDQGNYGFDLLGPDGERIEVKSRQAGRWGNNLMFDFSRHTADANEVFCVAWDDRAEVPFILAAFRAPVSLCLARWGTPRQAYAFRTTLRKLRVAAGQEVMA